ncbi:hypothetical protein L1049_027495 [Liquidambar formosana]|uniref:Uncharacterized protein n=1 Tax=Liquidambar formosana TaxID=63359 RepID=A0AAP0RIU7_LIQFO
MRWEKLQIHTRLSQEGAQEMAEISGPGKRWGHTCNAIRGGKLLYVFGGYGKDNCQTNQVHVFDTAKQTWSEPVIKGTPPTPRDSHSCTNVGDNLFVFGGTDGRNPLKDLHILDTSSHTWISPSVRGEGPEAREGHSAALIGKRLFIFGGCGKSSNNSEEAYYNDLYILNTETFVWKHATTSGTPPSSRDSHTCSSWKNKIIVIGGEDEHDYYLSDVHILDADTLVWRVLNTSGQKFPPRAGHSTVAFGKNLFVFGGFTDAQNLYDDLHMLDVETGIWTKVTATGDGPSARFSVAGDSLDPLKGGVLVFMGGCNRHLEALDDMYYLFTELARENGRDDRRLEKLSLRKQLKLKCQEQYLYPPLNDKTLIKFGTNADLCQPMPVASYGQPSKQNFPLNESQHLQGKKIFHAKVTESFPDGYTIETIIDGKPLRGILFSNRPSFSNTANGNSSRKRSAGDVGGVRLHDNHKSKSNTAGLLKQDAVDHKQADGVHGSTSHEAQTDDAAASILKNTAPSDSTHPHEVYGNPNPPVAPVLNSDGDGINNVPNSITEVRKENTSATVKDSTTLALNPDGREPTTNAHSLPAKSI